MRKTSFIVKSTAGLACVCLLLVAGCQKTVHGYLSDRIYYQVDPFYVQQGVTTVTSSLVTDGSTAPLTVKILALRDANGKDADSLLRTPRSIVTFTGTVTAADSTLDLLKAKLKDSLVRPFNIAEVGGRLQFTGATTFVPPGTYNMDLSVSNVRGTKVIQDACKIIIEPLATTYTILYKRLSSIHEDLTSGPLYTTSDADIMIDVEHVSGTPTSQIIYKWVDMNGAVFSPAKGEVAPYRPAARPQLHAWSPYYPEVYGDSTISIQIPDVGLRFPYFAEAKLPGGATFADASTAIVYYRINNVELGPNDLFIQSCTSLQFLTSGTYYVTVHLKTLAKKG